jgi:hypothetical protein
VCGLPNIPIAVGALQLLVWHIDFAVWLQSVSLLQRSPPVEL